MDTSLIASTRNGHSKSENVEPPRRYEPFQAIETRCLIIAEKALRVAWKIIRDDPEILDAVEAKGNSKRQVGQFEDLITETLLQVLTDLFNSGVVDGFNDDVFSDPQRSGQFVDYSGKRLKKAPDITIAIRDGHHRVADRRYRALFIECKRIQTKAGTNVSNYVNTGLIRYLNGEYAWRMPHAMMLAYVGTSQQLPEALDNQFNRLNDREKFCVLDGPTQCDQGDEAPAVFETTHCRQPTGNITIRHLWLNLALD